MKAVFVSKNSAEYDSYERALVALGEQTQSCVCEITRNPTVVGEAEASEDDFGAVVIPSNGTPNDNAQESLGSSSVREVCGKYVLFADERYGVVVLNGECSVRKQALRFNQSEENIRQFTAEVKGFLDIKKLADSEMFLFVHLGDAGDLTNVINVEKNIKECYMRLNQDVRYFCEIRCLSSLRNDIFCLKPGMIRLPRTKDAVFELCDSIDFSTGIDDFLTVVALRFSLGADNCDDVVRELGRERASVAGWWLENKISRINLPQNERRMLEQVAMLCRGEAKPQPIKLNPMKASLMLGKLLRKEI